MKKNLTGIFAALIAITSVITIPIYKANAAVQTPITRSQVEKRSVSMMDLTWTYSSDKNSNISSKYSLNVTLPKQFQGVTTAQFTGIPYDWGGIDGIDTNSYNTPWTGFLDAVSKGAFTGNVSSQSGLGYIPGTAGMDCSGFVQAAFNIVDYKQSSTTLLNNYFTKIDLNSLQHMDILDKPGNHVVIFDKWGTLNGINGAFTYESTPDQTYGGIQGTKRYFISINTINSGYIPARYINIVDDTTTISSAPNFKIGGYAKVSNVTSCANLRSNSGTNYTILNTIPKGTILNLNNYSNGCYQVAYNGQTGWIGENTLGSIPSNQYVTVTGAYQLNIRINSYSTAQIIGILSQGQYAQKLDQTPDGSWYKISINGIQGWSSSKYLTYIQ
ncbi:SH3 domain-containing protein [Clostridiaceae bacterium UIB06]|uniref:SH3 domain-containing protein n=1 Tax=Clostridium thailandense TaxID=2794346 RepID=A0A949TZZ3_9CLOT|nr:SH3 domain-containing protein [Clostridium thailandense]MBV7273704.1 SH3 domain-containing protein [Clostridium thailandense]MCH5137096.1 SH3 domain-containing protein [Clostridiaceae bacterium UIB06]